MELLIALLLLLAVSTILGKLLERFGVVDIVGQILAGIILGPALLGIVAPSSVLSGIAEVSIFFILLFIGLQLTTEVLTNHLKSAALFTLSSFVIPITIMSALGVFLFGIGSLSSIALAVAIGVPSISIISVLVYRRNLINIEDGKRILSGVIITDIIAFLILAAELRATHIYATVIGFIIFLAVLLYVDRLMRYRGASLRAFFDKLLGMHEEPLVFAIVIIMSLVIAAILQLIGITYVLGALFAGMLVHKTTFGNKATRILSNTFRRLNDSFFIPLFFSIAGLNFVIPKTGYLELLLALLAVTMVVGGVLNYVVAKDRLSRIKKMDAIGILGSRGAVGIIIATIAFQDGIINTSLYSLALVGTIALSIVMPLLLTEKINKAIASEAL